MPSYINGTIYYMDQYYFQYIYAAVKAVADPGGGGGNRRPPP